MSGTTGELTGTVSGVNILPWTVQIFAPGAGFCLRAEVVSQTQDLVMNLVEPDEARSSMTIALAGSGP